MQDDLNDETGEAGSSELAEAPASGAPQPSLADPDAPAAEGAPGPAPGPEASASEAAPPAAPSAAPAGPPPEGARPGEVKWFNPVKGFGFVRLPGESRDAFLHVSALSAHGMTTLHPGAEITCVVADGPRGLQVQSVVSIESQGTPQPHGGGGPGGERRPPAGPLQEMDGTVKFFNARKGFGFVAPDNGGADVFLPARVLTRCGIMSVQPSQRLRMQVRSGLRGMAAESVQEIR